MAGFTPLHTVVGPDEQSGFQPLREVTLGLQPQRNPISAGLSSGVDVLQGLGYSALGGLADAVGAGTARDWANEQARRNSIDAGLNGRPDLERIEDQTLGSAVPFAAYQVAKQVPTMAAILGAQFVPGAGQAASALGLTRLGAVAPRIIGGGGLEAGANFAARRAALAQGADFAASSGTGAALGYGSLYGESVEGGDPSPYKAMALAPFYGVAEAALPSAVKGAFRAPERLAGGLGTRMLKAGGLGTLGEAGTETFQNELEMGMRNDLTDEQKFSRRLNSAVVGGLVGGPFGSLAGIPGQRTVDDGKQFDLTKPDGGPVLPLGYSPLAGTPIIFPDGTVTLGSEQELQARFPNQVEPARGLNTTRVGNASDPLVINVDRAGTAATSYDDTQALLDPGAELGRQRYLELRQQQEQKKAAEQQSQEALDQTTSLYGIKPVDIGGQTAFSVLGGRVYGQSTLNQLVGELLTANQAKPEGQQLVEAAVINAGLVNFDGKPVGSVKQIASKVSGVLKSLNLAEATNPQAAAAILNDQVAQLVAAGKNEADPKLGKLAMAYEALTGGQTPPALQAKPKESGNAGQNSASGQSAATGVATGNPVVSGSVAATGSVPAGNAGLDRNAGGAGAGSPQVGAVASPSGEQTASVSGPEVASWEDYKPDNSMDFDKLPDNQKEIWRAALAARAKGEPVNLFKIAEDLATENVASDPRMDALTKVFGERNAQVIFDHVAMGLSQQDIADKLGVTQQAISKIVGPKAKAEWPAKIAAAGMTVEQMADLLSTKPNEAANGRSEVESEVFGGARSMFDVSEGVEEGEAIEGGLNNFIDTAGGSKAAVEGFTDLQDKVFATLEKLRAEEAKGDKADPAVIAELNKTLQEGLADVKNVEAKAAAEVRATAGKESKKDKSDAATNRKEGPKAIDEEAAAEETATDELKSDFDKARDAWDNVAAAVAGAPMFDDLTRDQQETFVDFGEENWTRQDVMTELKRLEKSGVFREMRSTSTTDSDGSLVNLDEQTLPRLERFPGIGRAIAHYRNNGLANVLDAVTGWFVTGNKVSWDGAFTVLEGKPVVALHARSMLNDDVVEWTTHHELGHAVDQVHLDGGGVFSGMPEFNVRVVNNRIVPMGSVMNQVFQHYTAEPDSDLSKHLVYPFDRTQNSDLDAQAVREEVFAQLWAAYNTRAGREFLEDNLPDVAVFMEDVYETVRQTDYATATANAGANQGQESGQAAPARPAQRGQVQREAAPLRANKTQVAQPESKVTQTINRLPPQTRAPVGNTWRNLSRWTRKGLDRVVFTVDLLKTAAKQGLVSASKFQRLLELRGAMARDIELDVEKVADMYAAVPDNERGVGPGSVNEFIFDSTRTGKWGYDSGSFKADPDMAKRFDALSEESRKFVEAVFDHGKRMLALKKQTVLDSTNSIYDALIAKETDAKAKAKLEREKTAELAKFQRLFAIREGLPYAPIKRVGNYVVIAKSDAYLKAEQAGDAAELRKLEKDPDHYHVSFTESENEAARLQEQLDEQGFFKGGSIEYAEKEQLRNQLFGGESMLNAVTKLKGLVDAQIDDDTSKQEKAAVAKMQRLVSDLYLQTLAENSARKTEMRRRGVAGEVDMLKSFAMQGRADAQFLASVKYASQTQDVIQEMRKQVKSGGVGTRNRRSELFNEIMARYAQTLDYDPSPVADKLNRLTSIWYLSTSPAYYLQNLTQPFMLSLPVIAGRHEYVRSANELLRAYNELIPLMKSAAKGFNQQLDYTKLPKDVQSVIGELVKRGRVDIGIDTELGRFEVEGDSKLGAGWNKVDNFLRSASQKMEAMNRLSTAIAAYRLELQKSNNAEKATEYADRILTETHGDYTRFNAPRAFNTSVGKVMLQFRKYQLIQLTLLGKLFKEAGFSTAEERAAAKALAFVLGHTGVMAGVTGLPGYAAISAILGALLGDDNDKFDLTQKLRQLIGDDDLANLIMKGAPARLGVDLSGKLGMGNALSVLPFTDVNPLDRSSLAEAMGTLVSGPAGGLVFRAADGIGLIANGNYYKGVELLMPTGLSNMMKAYRIGTEGVTRRNGDLVMSADEVNFAESVAQALGFTPTDQAVRSERAQYVRDVDQNFQERSKTIKNDYAKAAKDGDSAAKADAREAWKKLQQARKEKGYTPQPMSDLLKAPQEQTKRERQVAEGVPFNKQNKRFVQQLVEN